MFRGLLEPYHQHPTNTETTRARVTFRKPPEPKPTPKLVEKPKPKPVPKPIAKTEPPKPKPRPQKPPAPKPSPPKPPKPVAIKPPPPKPRTDAHTPSIPTAPRHVRPLTSNSHKPTNRTVPVRRSDFSTDPGRPGSSTNHRQTEPRPQAPPGPPARPVPPPAEPRRPVEPSPQPAAPVTPSPAPAPAPQQTPTPAPAEPTPSPQPNNDSGKGKGTNRDAAPIGMHPKIDIPDDLRRSGYKSFVRVEFKISPNGKTQVTLLTSTGDNLFDRHIQDALSKWQWEPKIQDGKAVESTERIKFDLES